MVCNNGDYGRAVDNFNIRRLLPTLSRLLPTLNRLLPTPPPITHRAVFFLCY